MFDTIVLATDGSDSAERAVTLALDLAERFDADFHACYVLDAETPSRETGEAALSVVRDRDDDVTTILLKGDPVAEICTYADDIGADLVVTGTHGRDGAGGNLLGSVAEAVVSRSPVPVLTARLLGPDGEVDAPITTGDA